MKTYVEVACTIYKTILVEVEHERGTDEFDIIDLALDAACDLVSPDDTEVTNTFSRKPDDHGMSFYDEFLEIVE